MTKAMYEDLLERNRLQISELNTLTEEQDKHIAELEKENAELREKVERYYRLLEKSMDCETCKYCDFSDDMKKEPCNSCFFDSSKWELKEEIKEK